MPRVSFASKNPFFHFSIPPLSLRKKTVSWVETPAKRDSLPRMKSTSAPATQSPSPANPLEETHSQLALPLTDSERRTSRRQLDKLHPGNRFRLMFGQPLLRQELQADDDADL